MSHDFERVLVKAWLTSEIVKKVFEILERDHPEILAKAITEVVKDA